MSNIDRVQGTAVMGKGGNEIAVGKKVTGRRPHQTHTLVTKLLPSEHKEGKVREPLKME